MIATFQRHAVRHGGLTAAIAGVAALLILLPGFGFLWLLLTSQSGTFDLSATHVQALHETLVMLLGVAVLTGVIGVGTAWLVSIHDFPLRRAFEVLLLLPLAFPTYLAAFIAVDLLHFFGPVQGGLRWLTGWKSARDYWFPEMRSLGGAILVLGLVLFPYVYVPCRIVFARTGRNIIDAARLLGSHGADLFLRVGLPIVLPALAGGVTLALLETLNDIGATEYLGVSSLSVLIRDLWANRGDLGAATRVAALLLLLTVMLIALDPTGRNRRAVQVAGRNGATSPARIPLAGWHGRLATLACLLPIMLGFVVPALFLLHRAFRYSLGSGIDRAFFDAAATTISLGALVSVIVVGAGALLAIGMRLLPRLGRFGVFAALGYATPGTVLALAVLPVIRTGDDLFAMLGIGTVLTATTGVVVYALATRFLGIGVAQGRTALARLPLNVDAVARVHGMGDFELATRVHLPVILPGLMLAGLLVFIDTVKELPATILLRPLELETLATRAYALASAGQFEHAALDALMIVGLSGFAAWLLARRG